MAPRVQVQGSQDPVTRRSGSQALRAFTPLSPTGPALSPLLLGQKHPEPGVLTVQKALCQNLQFLPVGSLSWMDPSHLICYRSGDTLPTEGNSFSCVCDLNDWDDFGSGNAGVLGKSFECPHSFPWPLPASPASGTSSCSPLGYMGGALPWSPAAAQRDPQGASGITLRWLSVQSGRLWACLPAPTFLPSHVAAAGLHGPARSLLIPWLPLPATSPVLPSPGLRGCPRSSWVSVGGGCRKLSEEEHRD